MIGHILARLTRLTVPEGIYLLAVPPQGRTSIPLERHMALPPMRPATSETLGTSKVMRRERPSSPSKIRW